MDIVILLKYFAALVLVVGLMAGLAFILRIVNNSKLATGGKNRRLSLVENMSLDHKRRAVILKCDDTEHLIILGSQSETVVTEIKKK